MLNDLPETAVIAHRGASAYAPENTLAAFKLAVRQGADALEMDIRLTLDRSLVIIHDRTVDRTTNGSGAVHQLPLAEIKKLDAGMKYDSAFSGEKIPTLQEVFEELKGTIPLNIEIKPEPLTLEPLVVNITDCVRRHNVTNQVLFSSFSPFALRMIHQLLPEVPLGLLASRGLSGLWARSWIKELIPHQSLHLAYQDVNSQCIDSAHRQGRKVFAYTVNHPHDIDTLVTTGADGFFTDDPPLAIRTIGKHS